MATASDARAWARAGLRGIGNSLYTPFSGIDGDEIDWGAYRTLVRYCVGGLGYEMLWCTSGIAEFWALTLDERKRLQAFVDRFKAKASKAKQAQSRVKMLERMKRNVEAQQRFVADAAHLRHLGRGVLALALQLAHLL